VNLVKSKILEGLNRTKSVLLEENIASLQSLSDPGRVSRGKNLKTVFKGLTQDSDGQAITNWVVDSYSGNGTYNVEVGISVNGGLFELAKEWNPKKFSTELANADIRVYCPCKDFYWSGAKYNLGPNGSIKGVSGDHTIHKNAGHQYDSDVITHAPDIRDPERKNVLCMHLSAVCRRFSANAFDIMSKARAMSKEKQINPIDINAPKKKSTKRTLKKDDPKEELVRKTFTEGMLDGLNKDSMTSDESKNVVNNVIPVNETPEETTNDDTTPENTQETLNKDVPDTELDVNEVVGTPVIDDISSPDINESNDIEEGFSDIIEEEHKIIDEKLNKDKTSVDPKEIIT